MKPLYFFRTLLLVATLLSTPLAAVSGPAIRILETDPPSGAELNAREPLYVRVAYESTIPLRFQVRGLRNGSPVTRSASFNPAPAYPAGKGEAVAWVAFGDVTVIDEIELEVVDRNWQPVAAPAYPVEMHWNGAGPAAWRTPAPWAKRLSDAQQQMVSQAAHAGAVSGNDGWWSLLFMLMGLSIPGYLFLQAWSALKWHGRWRTAALWPLAGMVPLLLYTLFAFFAGSNLWPLLLLFLAPVAFLYLVALGIARRMSGRSSGVA